MEAPPHPANAGLEPLADRLSALARTLERETDLDATLSAIVRATVDTVPGADEASISAIARRREVRTLASTGQLPRDVDVAQYETGQGPCLDSLYESRTVRLRDLADEQRWPHFTGRARALGVGSMIAVQLFVEGDDLGALNIVSRSVDAFDDDSEHVALLFAAHAAVAMSGAEQRDRLETAMSTRDLIGQAKGILMERFKVTGDQAFALLVQSSQASNRKLRDIADELTSTGTLRGGAAVAGAGPGLLG